MAFKNQQFVVCPGKLDTGIIVEVRSKKSVSADQIENLIEEYNVKLDADDELFITTGDSIHKFIWKKRKFEGTFLVIAKAWKNIWGERRLRIQYHRVRSDGSIGGRIIPFDKANGKVVKRYL